MYNINVVVIVSLLSDTSRKKYGVYRRRKY